jgi:hypothetical protein
VLFNQFSHVFRFKTAVENLIRVDYDDRANLTEAGATTHNQAKFIPDTSFFKLFDQG